eukprot:jgi/Tetstr1/465384/TSEL_010070.t1
MKSTHGVLKFGSSSPGGRRLPVLHSAKVAATIGLELAAERTNDHWATGHEPRFIKTETELRELNRKAARLTSAGSEVTGSDGLRLAYDAFLSHSFRRADTQELKRRLISELSRVREGGKKAGLVYWADFLDLANRGPVPWRREIEEGIQSSSKFLAFIDGGFLTSFNCVMEVAAAFKMQKPVVPIILDQEAWSLLTTPNGADRSWDASEELRSYDGQEFLGGALFSKATLRTVFQRLSNINFCSCRGHDVQHWGLEHVIKRFQADVNKDLPYLKEWTQLNEQALKWHSTGRAHSSLLSSDALEKWKAWCGQALKYNMEPPPTRIHKDYISDSERFSIRRKRVLCALGVFILLLILGGGVGSAIMGFQARWAAAEARDNAAIAEEKSQLALANQLLAERNVNLAAILLLSSNRTPATGRERRTLLQALKIAHKLDRLDMVMPQLQSAVRYMAYEPYWQYELEGHIRSSAIKFSIDGSHLVSGGSDFAWRVWRLEFQEGSLMPVPHKPSTLSCLENGESVSVDWGSDGMISTIAGGTINLTICLWRKYEDMWKLHDKIVPEDPIDEEVTALAFSPSGRLLASGASDGALRVWDVSSRPASLHAIMHLNTSESVGIRSLAWTPDSNFLLAGGVDRVLSVIDMATGTTVANYSSHADLNDISTYVDAGEGAAWSRLRVLVATDYIVPVAYVLLFTLERPAAGDCSVVLTLEHTIPKTNDIMSVAWSPVNGDVVATTESNVNLLQMWDFNESLNSTTGEEILSLTESAKPFPLESRPIAMSWGKHAHVPGSDGGRTTLAVATAAGPIIMLQSAPDLGPQAPRMDRVDCTLATDAGIKHSVRGEAVNSLLTQMTTTSFHGSTCLYRRDSPTSAWAATHLLHANDTEGDQAKRVAMYSPDDSLLAIGCDDGRVIVYNVAGDDPVELHSHVTHEGVTRVLSFDPSSTYAASAGSDDDPTVLIWRVADPEIQLRLAGQHTNAIRTIDWVAPFDSASRTTVVSAGDDGAIVLWAVRLEQGNALVAEGSTVIGQLEEGARYNHIQMGANGLLAAGDTDGVVSLWGVDAGSGTWELVHRQQNHAVKVQAVIWVGNTLVSGAGASTVHHIQVEPGSRTVLRHYRTSLQCSKFSSIGGGAHTQRVLCIRTRGDAVGHQRSDPDHEPTIEVETVPVGFDNNFQLFQQMVYGRLNVADLAALGFQDLARLVENE